MKTLILVRGSSVLKKVTLALSGLLLFTFLIFHLIGNLLIFNENWNAINIYARKLEGFGPLLWGIELVLLTIFVIHIVYAIVTSISNSRSRNQSYYKIKSAGKPSQKSIFSTSAIWTGLLLFLFTVLHLKTFKFGPGIMEGYLAEIQGQSIRDLHRLIVEVFQKPWYVIGYVAAMIPLGMHLRHGFSSAFQSLGVNSRKYEGLLDRLGIFIAVLISGGFAVIPVWIYFTGGKG
ncbi:MAG: succinate dehydrogenase cytochrome b subunit [Oscillatoria sp. Prado101]|jgi:succinate dehydrogenase / fumarate reductase cytochrome b subunit|nr:succinate dehydrogenase cytochrome b subunit [Oscillatoria sp. Prado101]